MMTDQSAAIPTDDELQHIYFSTEAWAMCFNFSEFRAYILLNLEERELHRRELQN